MKKSQHWQNKGVVGAKIRYGAQDSKLPEKATKPPKAVNVTVKLTGNLWTAEPLILNFGPFFRVFDLVTGQFVSYFIPKEHDSCVMLPRRQQMLKTDGYAQKQYLNQEARQWIIPHHQGPTVNIPVSDELWSDCLINYVLQHFAAKQLQKTQ